MGHPPRPAGLLPVKLVDPGGWDKDPGRILDLRL